MGAKSVGSRVLGLGLWLQAGALVLGISLHASATLSGRALFYGRIFTPALDVLLTPLIAVGGLLGVWGLWAARRRPRWLRAAGLFVSAYFVISIPVHLKTLLTWSTAHFAAFPERYSLFIIPVQVLFLLVVAAHLRGGETERSDGP